MPKMPHVALGALVLFAFIWFALARPDLVAFAMETGAALGVPVMLYPRRPRPVFRVVSD